MPLPAAHALAGVAIYKGLDRDGTLAAWPRLLAAVTIAVLPDIDLIPGIIVGEPNRWHHVGLSHSLVVAMIAALIAGPLVAALARPWPLVGTRLSAASGTTLMIGLLLGSHVLLDAFNTDFRPPSGPPMFWPLSTMPVQIYPWFVDVAKLDGEGNVGQFIVSVLTPHNLYAVVWEVITLLPIVVAVVVLRRQADRKAGLRNQ